jgi:hypothetical protein
MASSDVREAKQDEITQFLGVISCIKRVYTKAGQAGKQAICKASLT